MPLHNDLTLPDSLSVPQALMDAIAPFLPLTATLLSSILLIWLMHRLLIGKNPDLGNEKMFPRQLVMMGLTLACIVATVLAMPVGESSRNQIIGLIGLVISGVFAFSSGTIFSNLMAGILLRVTKPFRIGDFVQVGTYFGRVAERGLFDTEIQSENRELIAIPNTYLISNPISRVLRSGAIVSASLSLGYDTHHAQIEPLLIDAAENCGLEEPFVHILELGNYAITYRVSGMLSEVKGLITARSKLFRAVLDVLHEHDIEIMSPSFMNQRRIDEDQKVIPKPQRKKTQTEPDKEPLSTAEDIVFDKAEQAEQIDTEKKNFLDNIQQLEQNLKDAPDDEKPAIKAALEANLEGLKSFEAATNELVEDDRKAETASAVPTASSSDVSQSAPVRISNGLPEKTPVKKKPVPKKNKAT